MGDDEGFTAVYHPFGRRITFIFVIAVEHTVFQRQGQGKIDIFHMDDFRSQAESPVSDCFGVISEDRSSEVFDMVADADHLCMTHRRDEFEGLPGNN